MAALVLMLLAPKSNAYQAADFHWLPPFLAVEEKPSLTFILDTSSSMLKRAYSDPFDGTREYFGYFDTRSFYSYNAESDTPHFFADDATGEWSGNFLNWAAMLRIDVARKVLTGGKIDDQSGCYASEPLSHRVAELPFNATELDARMTAMRGVVTIKARDDEGLMLTAEPDSDERYDLRVKVEGEDNRGLLQSVWDQARVALVTFEEGEPNRYPNTGYSAEFEEIIGVVNSVSPQGGAPLATTLHAVYENFRRNGAQGSKATEPFREPTVPCSRQRVILVSAGEGREGDGILDGCTDLLEVGDLDHTPVLHPADGMQNWDFYVVCLAGDPSAPLPDATKLENFKEIFGEGMPDNLFTAESWRELAKVITHKRQLDTPGVASGTATAVSTQTRSGEGAAYQAIFLPSAGTKQTPPPWSGEVHAYLVDAQGNLREAIKSDQGGKKTAGRIIEFAGERIYAHTDSDGNGLIDEGEINATALDGVDDIVLWSASTWIKELKNAEAITQRSSYASDDKKRYIITFVDINQNMVVDEDNGEIQDFALPDNPAEAKLNSPDYFFNYLTLYESASGTMGLDLTHSVQKKIHDLRKGKPLEFANFQATVAKRQVDFIR
ncbi:MAG: hypothetical protein Q8R89_05605, partial [Desulfomicrobium sp.]|nr:hypothetical protein [Desulfomicrobium sp.]